MYSELSGDYRSKGPAPAPIEEIPIDEFIEMEPSVDFRSKGKRASSRKLEDSKKSFMSN